MTTYNQCFRCGWNLKTDLRTRKLYTCQAPHCDISGVIFCEECMKELNPKKSIFGSSMPDKCPACGVGILRYVPLTVREA